MLIRNSLAAHHAPLDRTDADALGVAAAREVERFLMHRDGHAPTPLVALPGLAQRLAVSSIHVKDVGYRLGLGSFKALGGACAVVRLVLEVATQRLGRHVDVAEWRSPEIASSGQSAPFSRWSIPRAPRACSRARKPGARSRSRAAGRPSWRCSNATSRRSSRGGSSRAQPMPS